MAGTGGAGAQPNTLPGFTNLAPPMGSPLDPNASTTVTPTPPTGWKWYAIDGTFCRDGSPNGIYVRFTTSDKLLIYLEGGGACSNAGFCHFNPPNINTVLTGTGETVIGTVGACGPGRQQPGNYSLNTLSGVYDAANAANPFKDWNMVYIPYCTGDVHFGTKEGVTVPGTVPAAVTNQKFVGYRNMQKFIGRVVPTFADKVKRVVISGASAGSFGAALNYSMVQDAFGAVKVDALLDSGAPFSDMYMPVCMQKRWRDSWGLNDALPPDCTECRRTDGGGFIKMADFLIRKHPNATLAVVSTTQDEVIRLFFSVGLQNCMNYDAAEPVAITLGQFDPNVYYPGPNYEAAMKEVREMYKSTGRFATYFMPGALHQHIFRQRFFEPAAGGVTIATFTQDWLDGKFAHIGP
jgi:hypothetical protein